MFTFAKISIDHGCVYLFYKFGILSLMNIIFSFMIHGNISHYFHNFLNENTVKRARICLINRTLSFIYKSLVSIPNTENGWEGERKSEAKSSNFTCCYIYFIPCFFTFTIFLSVSICLSCTFMCSKRP